MEGMTPTEIMTYSESLIARRFPNKVVKIQGYNEGGSWIPAYEWYGAGSEKGGSSGHLFFRKIVFADSDSLAKDKCLAVSLGLDKGGIDLSGAVPVLWNDGSVSLPYRPGMAGVFREAVPREFADRLIEEYRLSTREGLDEEINYWHSRKRKVSSALREFLRSGNRAYSGISLFAFDGEVEGLRKGIFAKRYTPFDCSLRDVLEPFDLEEFSGLKLQNPERGKGIELSNRLADCLLSFGGFTISDNLDYLRPSNQERILGYFED